MADAADAGVDKTKVEGAVDETGVKKPEDEGAPPDPKDKPELIEKKVVDELLAKKDEEISNYKKALTQKRGLRNKPAESAEVVVPDNEGDDDGDAPVTRNDLKEVVQVIQSSQVTTKVDTMLNNLVKDPRKRELVKHYYETRFSQMGTSDDAIQSGITDAIDLVDSKINKKKAEELGRKNMQEHQPPLSGSDADRGAPSRTHKFSDDQVKSLTARAQRLGMDPAKFIAEAWKNQNRG